MEGIRYIVAAICALSAAYLAIKGNPAWGWFLFAAVIASGA